jgi:hypothetical protein
MRKSSSNSPNLALMCCDRQFRHCLSASKLKEIVHEALLSPYVRRERGIVLLAILLLGSHHVTEYLAPTEGWSDGSQNCLHDVGIVRNT